MSLFTLFTPKWKHPNPEVRAVAVASLADQTVLAELAENDASDQVRRVALQRLTDQDHLGRIARISTHPFNAEALERMTDPKLIVDVARRAETAGIRALAVKRIDDADTLHQISTVDLDPGVRQQAKSKRLQLGADPVRDFLKSVLSKLEVAALKADRAADFHGDLDHICAALVQDNRFRVHGIVEDDKAARAPGAPDSPATAGARTCVELLAGKPADGGGGGHFHIKVWRDGPQSFNGLLEEKSREQPPAGGSDGEFLLGARQ